MDEVLEQLGFSREKVKGAIRTLLNSNPALKAEVCELAGGYTKVGEVNGQSIYARSE